MGGCEALRIMAFPYAFSAIGYALAWNWDALMAARFIVGVGIGGSSQWLMNASIAARNHAAPFVFFAVMLAVQFFVVLFFVYPETKRRSPEQIHVNPGVG
jgi:predicted MFS family arabinose efflux permease